MARVQGKAAVVTGGSAGIGKAIAQVLAREGAQVAVTDIDEKQGAQTVKEIEQAGGKARFWKLDVSKEKEVQAVFREIAETFGKIDILVNNAGITGVDKPTHEVTEEEWDMVFDVDVKGVFFCTKYAVPLMKKNGGGSIVNISSIYGLVGSRELAPYHAAKGAVTLMTRKDAVTYGKDGIRVNSVHPGTIMTPLVEELGSRIEGGLEAYEKMMADRHPIGHTGKPEDVAYGVLYLASDESPFTTGAALTIDGGYTAQ
jgi:NAD(P)-dependent dehydrogenase (short-subunit alcohol dehydrogenase family)